MATPAITDYLKYANLQMAAEALYGFDATLAGAVLIPGDPYRGLITSPTLEVGNEHASKFTATEATLSGLTNDWIVVEHKSNTSTGFSGTLFKAVRDNPATGVKAGELVLSFRSTEFIDDAARDNQATNTLEIKEKGFAFGQIADMEAWYSELNAGPADGKPAGALYQQQYSVTGYSLGGHLATAFNLLRHEDHAETRVASVYTFNGAGVGTVTQGTLSSVMQYFNSLRDNPSQIDATIDNADLLATYQSIRTGLTDRSLTLAQAKATIDGFPIPASLALTPDSLEYKAIVEDKTRISQALTRAMSVQDAAHSAPGLSSGTSEGPLTPADIPDKNIAAEGLDYQMAVLLAGERTAAVSLIGNTAQAVLGRSFGGNLGNQHDVMGQIYDGTNLSSPSAVANSQLHYGADEKIFIEDQPLYRGTIVGSLLAQVLTFQDIKLLVDQYSMNDFGDTHSLVLIVDSLNVQNLLQKLAPSATQSQIEDIFKAASFATKSESMGSQGKAEGNVLENVLNALGDILLGSSQTWKRLDGDLDGGTWADINPREDFYQTLQAITTKAQNTGLFGTLSLTPPGTDTANYAKDDFGAFLSLYAMSPLVLRGGAAFEGFLKGTWTDLYASWSQDKDLTASDRAKGLGNFSNDWYADRAAMVSYWRNAGLENKTTLTGVTASGLPATDQLILTDTVSKQTLTVMSDFNADGSIPTGKESRYISFGGKEADILNGGKLADHLYGMDGDDILSGNGGKDYLEGGLGNDTLNGGDEDDRLVGGKGNDNLNGGTGYDTYVVGQDTDVVIDTDGKGILQDASGKLIAGVFLKRQDGSYVLSGDPTVTATLDAGLTITLANGSKVVLPDFNSFSEGELRIQVLAPPSAPTNPAQTYFTTSNGTLTGTSQDRVESFQGSSGVDYVYADGTDINSAQGGADLILTAAGRDNVWAGAGNDWVEGGADGDIVFGKAGDDVVFGGQSQNRTIDLTTTIATSDTAAAATGIGDVIDGNEGKDTLIGDATKDVLAGGAGADVLIGGGGDDLLLGDATITEVGDNWSFTTTVGGTAGARNIELALNQMNWSFDPTVGSADALWGGAGADWINAGAGNDFLNGGSGADVLIGGAGDDVVEGGSGDDILIGDEPGVVGAAYEGNDILRGGSGKDELYGNGGNDILEGGTEDDSLYGNDGDDVLHGDAGKDLLFAGVGNDTLDGGTGDDQLFGGDGDDILIGGAGNDVLVGGAGRDTYIINRGDGVDTILDTPAGANSPEASVLVLGEGISRSDLKFGLGSLFIDLGKGDGIHLEGFDASQPNATPMIGEIRFSDGSSMSYQDILDQGFDLSGSQGNDVLFGTAVVDRISSYAGDDTIQGNAGDDFLYGGDGNDTYIFNKGDGLDQVIDTSGTNTIRFGTGISVGDLRLNSVGTLGYSVMEIAYDTLGSKIFILEGSQSGAARFQFADGTILTRSELLAQASRSNGASSGNDTWHGFDSADVMNGGAGNDVLLGYGGDDILNGGEGNDQLDGGSGDDILYGNAGDDFIEGGAGHDTLNGGEGSDTYLLAFGIAKDTVIDTGQEGDTIMLGQGIDFSSLEFKRDGNDLYVGITGPRNVDFSNLDAYGNSATRAWAEPAGLTIKDYYTAGKAWQVKTDAGETAPLTVVMAQIDAASENVAQHAYEDWVTSVRQTYFADIQSIKGVQSADNEFSIVSVTGRSTHGVEFATVSSNDSVIERVNQGFHSTSTPNNTFTWHAEVTSGGRPVLTGEWLDPVYDDTHLDANGNPTFLGFIPHYSDNAEQNDASLPLRLVKVQGADSYDALIVETLTAGASDNLIYLSGAMAVNAGDGNDLVIGGSWGSYSPVGNYINGGEGNDRILGSFDNDVILAGSGNDYLSGNDGDDTYLINADDTGVKLIDEVSDHVNLDGYSRPYSGSRYYTGGGSYSTDTIEFGPGLAVEDLNITLGTLPTSTGFSGVQFDTTFSSYQTMDISWGDGHQIVRILMPSDPTPSPWAGGSGVEFFKFSDGTQLTLQEMISKVSAIVGSSADDYLWGADGNDYISGLAGNDFLSGGPGNDILLGGQGADHLRDWEGNSILDGGDGNDYLYGDDGGYFLVGGKDTDQIDAWGQTGVIGFNRGDGWDNVIAAGSFTLSLGGGIALSDLVLSGNGQWFDLEIGNGEGIDLLKPSWLDQPEFSPIRLQIIGSDVSWFDLNAVFKEFIEKQAADPSIVSWEIGDALQRHELGRSDDQAYGGKLAYRYAVDGSLETLTADSLREAVASTDFGAVPQSVFDNHAALDLTLIGTAGDDALSGGDGNDTLSGNGGHDLLNGGTGDDTYIVSSADTNVHIVDSAGQDKLILQNVNLDGIQLGVGSLKITVLATGQEIHLDDFDPANPYAAGGVELFQFADGTVLTKTQLIDALGFHPTGTNGADTLSGTSLNDVITALDGDDVITALSGDDIVYGGGGSDILNGGTGNDLLAGGDGNDTYLFAAGDGQDRITDTSGIDRIVFAPGILASRVQVSRNNGEVTLSIVGDGTTSDSVTFAENGPGSYSVEQVEFADGSIWQAADILRALSVTQPTVDSPIADQAAVEDALFQFTVPASTFSDADLAAGDSLTMSASLADGNPLPDWLSFDSATQTFSGTPGDSAVGSIALRVTATDLAGNAVSSAFNLQVANVNDAPTGEVAIAGTGAQGEVLTATHTLSDGDGLGTIGYQWQSSSDGISWNDISGAIENSFALTEAQVNQQVRVVASYTDGHGTLESVTSAATGAISNVNDAPTGDFTISGEAAQGGVLSLSNTLSDADGLGAISYQWQASADGSNWADIAGQTASSLTLTQAEVGMQIRAIGSYVDGHGTSEQVFSAATTAIANVNDAPVAGILVEDQAATEDSPFAFTLPASAFSDVDVGDSLSYGITLADGSALPAWLSFDAVTATLQGTPTNGDVGGLNLRVTATDRAGATATQSFALSVANVNDAPVVGTALSDQSGKVGSSLSFALPNMAFTDVDAGDSLSYSANQADGQVLPSWLSFDATTQQFVGTPTTQGNWLITVTAKDLAGASASQTFSVAVAGGNAAPVVVDDTASAGEDGSLFLNGNVLSNDTDADPGTTLSLANAGTYAGKYGVLSLLANGSYGYVLNNQSQAVQALGAGVTAYDRFDYQASDGQTSTTGHLTIAVSGKNDTPTLTKPLDDYRVGKGSAFQLSVSSRFSDVDQGDHLTYKATLSNGKALPTWLKFDGATGTFSGQTPAKDKGTLEITVTASDGHGASSSVSDSFKLAYGQSGGDDGSSSGCGASEPNHGGSHQGDDHSPKDRKDDDRDYKNDHRQDERDDHGPSSKELAAIANLLAHFDAVANEHGRQCDEDERNASKELRGSGHWSQWQSMASRLDLHLSGSDGRHLGDDGEGRYGQRNDPFSGCLLEARNVLAGSGRVMAAQQFQSFQGLQEGLAKLG